MKSPRLRCALAAAALTTLQLAALPSAHAWTRISCDLSGTVATLPEQMRQYRTDGTEVSHVLFRLDVKAADIPEGARADTDCTEFVDRQLDVALDNVDASGIRKGKPLKLRYRYDESLGEAKATQFELVR